MTRLNATVSELWQDQARLILHARGISIRRLKKIFHKILFPWNLTYNNYRFMYKLQIQELPLFVIVAQNEQEIIALLNLALNKKLSLRVISGRHSSNVQNPNFYVDMSQFNNIILSKNLLSAGGGTIQGNIYTFLFENESEYHFAHGTRLFHPFFSHNMTALITGEDANKVVAFPGGSAGSVAISGLTTSGGIGSLKRTFGLTIDSVESYTIIVPPNKHHHEARKLHICPNKNKDLMWALSGGLASNFGIVTKVKYRLPSLNNIVIYSIEWPWKVAKKVLFKWLRTAPNRPNEFNEDLSMFAQHNETGIGLGGVYVILPGQSDEEAIAIVERELASLVKIDGTLHIKIATYAETITTLSNKRVYYPFSVTQIFFSSNIVDIDFLVDQMEIAKKQPGLYLFGIELLGGKISDVKPSETAFYPRRAKYFYDIFTFCESSNDVDYIKTWTKNTFNRIYDPVDNTVYVGFQIPNLKNHLHAYYGKNKDRLIEVKHKYDPFGVMNYPQGIDV